MEVVVIRLVVLTSVGVELRIGDVDDIGDIRILCCVSRQSCCVTDGVGRQGG